VRVETPDGARDATAKVACVAPAGAPIAIDAMGRAVLPEGCAKARCTSDRWLPADVAGEACKLGRAAVLTVELPADARGRFVVRLEGKRKGEAPIEREVSADAGGAPSLALAPVRPGTYTLSVGRPDRSWTCTAIAPARSPEQARVRVAWREPVVQRGRVTTSDGAGVGQVPVRAEVEMRRAEGSWTCAGGGAPVSSAADGSFALRVDPSVETLVVAGDWDDAHGMAIRARRGRESEPMSLVLGTPHRIVARILDERDAPMSCKALLSDEDRLEVWATTARPGSAREAKCSSDGKLTLGPILSSAFELEVFPDEALPARRRGNVDAGPVTDLGVIRVDRGESLAVDVRDRNDRPVSEALVTVQNERGVIVKRSARTGADGLASLKGLPRRSVLDLRVEAAKYATERRSGIASDAGDPVKIVLGRGYAIRGRVVLPDGGPAEKASVRAKSGAGAPSSATADPEGQFEIEVPTGSVELRASSLEYGDSDDLRIEVGAGQDPPEVELRLTERGLVRGVVLDLEGRPAPGATVLALWASSIGDPPEAGAVAATVTDGEGAFVLRAPKDGQGIVALLRGFAPAFAVSSGARELELKLGAAAAVRVKLPDAIADEAMLQLRDGSPIGRTIQARSRTDFTIEDVSPPVISVALSGGPTKEGKLVAGETTVVDFRSGGSIRGRVTHSGRGVPRAVVACVAPASTGVRTSGTELTDDDGRFELSAVAAGPQRIVAQSTEGRGEATVHVPEAGEARVDLEIADAGLDVAVTDARTGAPVGEAQVSARRKEALCRSFTEMASSTSEGGWRLSLSDPGCAAGDTSSAGLASFDLSVLGPYDVNVHAHDYEPWQGSVEVMEGRALVRVPLVPGGGAPRVRVLLQTAPPGASGTLYCVQPQRNNSTSPVSGEALCENAIAGSMSIAFRVPGLGIGRTTVDVPEHGETQAVVRVVRGGSLAVPVRDPASSAIRVLDAEGTVWNQPMGLGWPECGASTDSSGLTTYLCRELPAGPYTVEIGGEKRATAIVRPGETTTVY